MKDFFVMILQRIKKLFATALSWPFILLVIAIYIRMTDYYIFALMVLTLTKRQIDKLKGLGYYGKDK